MLGLIYAHKQLECGPMPNVMVALPAYINLDLTSLS